MADTNLIISTMALNVNGLNNLIKGRDQNKKKGKTQLYMYCPLRHTLNSKIKIV